MNPDERRQIPVEIAHLQHDGFVDILFSVQSKAVDPEVSEAGAEVGFAGPVGLKGVQIVADHEIAGMNNFVTGANRTDAHYRNVNIGRDFEPESYADLRVASDGDPCPRCEGKLVSARAIELAHVFKLGTKYSKAMNANFLDEEGQEKLLMAARVSALANQINPHFLFNTLTSISSLVRSQPETARGHQPAVGSAPPFHAEPGSLRPSQRGAHLGRRIPRHRGSPVRTPTARR
jgi:hypothetical protein